MSAYRGRTTPRDETSTLNAHESFHVFKLCCVIIIWRSLVRPFVISGLSFLKLQFSPSFIYCSAHCNSAYIRTIVVVSKLPAWRVRGSITPEEIFSFSTFMFFEMFRPAVGPTRPPVQWIQQGSVARQGDDAARSPRQGLRLWMSGAMPFLPPYTLLAWIGTALSYLKLLIWCI